MLRPLGDQRARPAVPCKEVTWSQLEPSVAHVQISQKPRRLDSKAILFPSGDKSGRILSPFSEIKTEGGGLIVFLIFQVKAPDVELGNNLFVGQLLTLGR